jgi:flagellar biosynthesis protein FlhB
MNNMNSRTSLNSQQVNDSTNDGQMKSSSSDVTVPLVAAFLVVFIVCQVYQSSSISELTMMQKEQLSSIKDLAMMQKTLSNSVSTIDIKLTGIIGGTVFVIAVFSGLTQIVGGLQALDDYFVKRKKRIEDENKKMKKDKDKNKSKKV